MTPASIIEAAIAPALIAGSILLCRRCGRDRRSGSQPAVLLPVIGGIRAVPALGLIDYRPSPGELSR